MVRTLLSIAVARATQLAQLTGATLHIVYAYQPLSRSAPRCGLDATGPTIDVGQVNAGIESAAREVLDHAAAHDRA